VVALGDAGGHVVPWCYTENIYRSNQQFGTDSVLLRRLWSLRRSRPWFVVCSGAVLLSLVAYPVVDWQLRAAGIAPAFEFWDFGAYGGAVDRWTDGEPLYVPDEDGGYHGSYLYPPVFVLVFAPFAALSPGLDAVVWGAVSVALLWLGLQALAAALGAEFHPVERLLLLAALVGFHPLLLSLKLGQASAFLGGAIAVAGAALVAGESRHTDRGENDRFAGLARLGSGAATAVAGVLKLAYAPVGAHLLARRERFVGAVAAGVGLFGVSVAVFGVETHLVYVDVLRWGAALGGDARPPTLWLPPYYEPLFAVPGDPFAVQAGGSLLVAALALCSGADRETFALGVAAVPLLAPQAYTYTFVVVLPAVVVLVATELDRDGSPVVPVVALGLFHVHAYGLRFLGDVVPPLLPGGASTVVWALQPGLWGTLLLTGVAALRVAQAASFPALGERVRTVSGRLRG
jgi:hypothetical protein